MQVTDAPVKHVPIGYRSKVLGGWLGKNIGGTLGGPYEGLMAPLFLDYYKPVPTEVMPNDDFELQLVWLEMLNKRGVYITPSDFAYYWQNHISYYISEYFMCQRNLAYGIIPPVSGAYNNWFINGMGAAIRSEIWAMIAPGLPDIAAAYAYMDASADHNEEGVYGAMLLAAMQSEAFHEEDPRKILEAGLRYVPQSCEIRNVANMVCDEIDKGTEWRKIRHLICASYSHPCDFTYVPTNIGFIILGLLSSENYSEALCNAVNCGYDADCTGATVGATFGIIFGADQIPEKWLKPIGKAIKVSEYIPGVEYPPDVDDLTDRVAVHAARIVTEQENIREHLHKWTGLDFLGYSKPVSVIMPSPTKIKLASGHGLSIELDYLDHPTIGYDDAKRIILSFTNNGFKTESATVKIEPPLGWSISADTFQVEVAPGTSEQRTLWIQVSKDGTIESSNKVRLYVTSEADTIQAEFTILGKSCWLVTESIPMNDLGFIAPIENRGFLDPRLDNVHKQQLSSDDMRSLIPGTGSVRFVQTDIYAECDVNCRLIANSNAPISVYLNDNVIIDKRHRSAGILPSWHLQNIDIHDLPRDMGFKDISLKKGWSRIMLRLEGASYPQECWFYLLKIDSPNLNAPAWRDFGLLTEVSNTRWRS
ncbi:MAG: ADP-ribosylglycohydrolase family protein [Armatimonadota bacterium]|nr:ADP-ribosylglycohydrolase family protein [bacterium]